MAKWVALATVMLLTGTLLAQAQSGYDLSWFTVDGGGVILSAGGSYTLGGAIGQPDTGALHGGGYTLDGGFWSNAGASHRVSLPMILKGS